MAKKGLPPQEGAEAPPPGEVQGKKESIELLRPDKKNARKMPKDRRARLKFSMHEFGDLSGIVLNEAEWTEGGLLVGGHQRMDGLRAAGAKEWVRVTETEGYIEHPKTGERFHIRFVQWPPEKHRQAQLVANSPHLQGEYDEAMSAAQLRELEDSLMFGVLGLDALQADLDKEAAEAEKELERQSKGAGGRGRGGQTPDKFAVIIECKDEDHQRELLDRFSTEGLDCRALF